MGKRIVLYLSLIFSCLSFSQGSKIELTNIQFQIRGDEAICSNVIRVTVYFQDGGQEQIWFEDEGPVTHRFGGRYWPDGTFSYPNIIRSWTNRIVSSIRVQVNTHEKRSGRKCRSGKGSFIEQDETRTVNLDACDQDYYEVYKRNGGEFEVEHTMKFNWGVSPLVRVDYNGSNIAGYDDDLKARAIGYYSNSSVYKWQYQVTNKYGSPVSYRWNSIPGVVPIRNLAVTPNTFLLATDIGKDIHIRVKPCAYADSPNFITYRLRKSAPHILSVSPIGVSCYDAEDGEATIRFDRALEAGDNLNISIYDRTRGEVVTSYEDVALDGNNSIRLQGLPPSGINGFRIDLITGNYNGEPYFTEGPGHTAIFNINRPSYVAFSREPQGNDVKCFQGDDGSIVVSANGGIGNYEYLIRKTTESWGNTWYPFNNATNTTITELRPDLGIDEGTYEIKIRDGNQCVAKEPFNDNGEIKLGVEVIKEVTIEAPDTPLQIEYITEESFDPTADGFTNGQIKVRVFGGTPFDDNTYNYIWRDVNGSILTTIDTSVETDGSGNPQFFVTLRDVGEGIYFLTVQDKNYSSATYTTGCFVENSSYSLEDPDPLTLQIEETNPISCNTVNTDIDKDKDGELTAIATGGVPLEPGDNGGLSYYYIWKKKNASGVWEVIKDKNEGEPVLGNLSEGEYAVNIEDANGIIIGTYVNNVLDEATDVTYDLQAPAPITIILDKQDVYCYGGNDGFIHLTVTGGTGAYDVQWLDDGSITSLNRDNLIEGFYTVIIEDEKGCSTRETIEITQPTTPLRLTYPSLYSQPTAFGLTDGWIEARVSGGTANADGSYNFIWADQDGMDWQSNVITSIDPDTNEFILRLQNIGKGYYTLTITDANHIPASVKDGCTITNGFQLEEPEPLRVVIEEDTPISCNQLNEYGDPFSDGVLIAHATGGIRFNPGLPYVYTWKKQNASGNWDVLTTQTDSIARNLSDGTYAVNIEDANGIILGEYVNNILVRPTDSTHVFREPRLLQVTLTKQDVYCYDGRDGWIEATIEGGTPPYTLLWNTGETTERIEELVQGDYDILVTDSRGCNAMATITLEQPIAPIEVTYTAFSRPSGIGNPDAWIEATIKGGTSFDDFSYTYNWVDVSGTSLNSQTQTKITPDNAFRIRLNGITAGRYYLTIQNKNYEIATTKEGCTFIDSEFTIYEPIEATIEEFTPISCNQSNEEFDPFSDGAIVGHVRGGVPFSNGLPYRYTWKKQNVAGEWEVLSNQNDSIATNLSAGWYALNAEDSMGQVMGIYESEILIRAIDSTFYFEEPLLLEVALSATPISCDTGNNGTASVAITGGTPPYTIEWSTGSTATTTTGLISGTYIVYVTDSRGCRAEGSIYIDQPGGLNIQIEEAKNPTCFEGEDGSIAVQITGGTPPYAYEWNTGENVLALNNLREGSYLLSIEDANGCRAFQEITLTDPLPIPLELGENRTICADQTLTLDIGIEDSGATYVWSSDTGFSSTEPLISLTEPGIYRATITTSLGCTTSDEVQVIVSEDEIDADFLLATQAYTDQEVILVNVSSPIGERVVWTVPEDVTVLGEETEKLILQFDAPGVYPIHLRSYQGDCYQDYEKNIIVEKNIETAVPQDDQQRFIKELLVYPNPTQGEFTIKIALAEVSNVNVRVINLITSDVMNEREAQGHSDYLLDFTAAYLPSGVYLLSVETPNGNAIRKLVVE